MQADGLTLRLERVVSAAPDAVFAACTEPAQLAEWWGPAGFTAPDIEIDLRPGGRYRIAMQPPNGELFYLHGEFVAIQPPNRLAYTFEWEPPDPDDRTTTASLTFAERGEGTQLTLEQGPFSTAARRALHADGWSEALDRLADHLRAR